MAITLPANTTPGGYQYFNAGAPEDGTTCAGLAAKGAILIDVTNANLYVNAGTQASPVWKLITRAA
jgi:hypothetical protein